MRTGTGDISIATSQDLVLQGPQSLIYTSGTGFNVNGTPGQPLSGFTQYNGILSLAATTASGRASTPDTLPASTFPTHGGSLVLTVGGNITGDMNANPTNSNSSGPGLDQQLPYDMTALGSQLKLQNWDPFASSEVLDQSNGYYALMGSFSALYATDAWMRGQVTGTTYYNEAVPTAKIPMGITPGDYQLAWYTGSPISRTRSVRLAVAISR